MGFTMPDNDTYTIGDFDTEGAINWRTGRVCHNELDFGSGDFTMSFTVSADSPYVKAVSIHDEEYCNWG